MTSERPLGTLRQSLTVFDVLIYASSRSLEGIIFITRVARLAQLKRKLLLQIKEVEVKVREVGKFDPSDVGIQLMRKAFHPEAEREALSHLFTGAIGAYKNPSSHRMVTIDAPKAVELIVLASHLLNIVDERSE